MPPRSVCVWCDRNPVYRRDLPNPINNQHIDKDLHFKSIAKVDNETIYRNNLQKCVYISKTRPTK